MKTSQLLWIASFQMVEYRSLLKITKARSCISRREKIRNINPVVPTAAQRYQTIGYSIVVVSATGLPLSQRRSDVSLSLSLSQTQGRSMIGQRLNPTKKYDWITIVFPRSLYINPELRSNRFSHLIYIY